MSKHNNLDRRESRSSRETKRLHGVFSYFRASTSHSAFIPALILVLTISIAIIPYSSSNKANAQFPEPTPCPAPTGLTCAGSQPSYYAYNKILPDQDVMIDSASPDTNFASSTLLYATNADGVPFLDQTNEQYTLFHLPTNEFPSNLETASFKVPIRRVDNTSPFASGTVYFTLHRIDSGAFDSNSVTWNTRPTGTSGVTYALPVASIPTSSSVSITFDITYDIRLFQSGGPNYGFILSLVTVDQFGVGSPTSVVIDSIESTTINAEPAHALYTVFTDPNPNPTPSWSPSPSPSSTTSPITSPSPTSSIPPVETTITPIPTSEPPLGP